MTGTAVSHHDTGRPVHENPGPVIQRNVSHHETAPIREWCPTPASETPGPS